MASTMKAIIKAQEGEGFKLTQVSIPEIGTQDVLIKVKAAAICGSDISIYKWDDPWVRSTVKPGLIVGHEFCGEVVAYGELVRNVALGDFVTVEGHLYCGICSHCRNGAAHVCPHQKVLGFEHPGAFAEYIAVPASNVIQLGNLPLIVASILDPFGNAVHASMKIPLTNSTVLVTGCGPIGLMVIALARYAGARQIFATEVSQYRLDLATQMGADYSLNPSDINIEEFLLNETVVDSGVDVFLEMSGNPEAIIQGFKVLRTGGQAVLMGLPKQTVMFDFANYLIAKGITVYGVIGREIYKTWDQVQKFLGSSHSSRLINLSKIVTHRLLFEEFDKGFNLMCSGVCGKVILFPNSELLQQSFDEVPDNFHVAK